ncbi:MAG: glutamine--fructose-6-phosphate transaminase (isomerizing) [Atribacterota bacterium]|nr:glutamine--fructose-6-phosphate transaminase (isomerizing) [Atribacterota bacterium]MDD5497020.1 glutamine--fructose-6-phosphate transaminase (isomerizing) [Atribacterota bacterium]
MCGIIGYIGDKNVLPILMQGLKKLEYRGYDSAGIAVLDKNNSIKIEKCKGKIKNLEELLKKTNIYGTIGLGHTRWATHGSPNDINAHPHCSKNSEIVVVHNGIIENYLTIKDILLSRGYQFLSDTDTEVLPHLIQDNYQGDLTEAVRKSLKKVKGSYALGVISTKEPDKIVASKSGSPLVIGIGEREMFIASDIPALLNYTRRVIFLDENEIATIDKNGAHIINLEGEEIKKEITYIDWDAEMAEKSGYKHYMLKEIYQQPSVIRGNLEKYISGGKVNLSDVQLPLKEINSLEKIHIIACGTASYAALVGKYIIESLAAIPVEVDYASEFRYKTKLLDKKTLAIVISQSGETADTIAALHSCQGIVCSTLAIVNVRGSTISREADDIMYINAGPEIGVASTKAFMGQLISLYLLAIFLGKTKNTLSEWDEKEIITEISRIPQKIETILNQDDKIKSIAYQFSKYQHFLYLGRDVNFPIALEGALKLKEISYIHAEAYPAGEMKHGPIALLDENFPVVALVLRDKVYDKMINNIKEVTTREAKVIALATEGDDQITKIVNEVIYVPEINMPILYPLLSVVPLQLFAYHIANILGRDVDKPRNLAKSVTVE